MVLKTCKGEVCTQPWAALHPSGDVQTLGQAFHPRFDALYAVQPQMWFADCPLGYFAEKENQSPVVRGGWMPGFRVQQY
jgi:N-acetylglucosamine-6-sulfatase